MPMIVTFLLIISVFSFGCARDGSGQASGIFSALFGGGAEDSSLDNENYIYNDYEKAIIDINSANGNVIELDVPVESVRQVNFLKAKTDGQIIVNILKDNGLKGVRIRYDGKSVKVEGNLLQTLNNVDMRFNFEGIKAEKLSSLIDRDVIESQGLDSGVLDNMDWAMFDSRFVYACDSKECVNKIVVGVFT